MISVAMILTGLLFISANRALVVAVGIGLVAGAAYREGAFYGIKKALKTEESCHRPK